MLAIDPRATKMARHLTRPYHPRRHPIALVLALVAILATPFLTLAAVGQGPEPRQAIPDAFPRPDVVLLGVIALPGRPGHVLQLSRLTLPTAAGADAHQLDDVALVTVESGALQITLSEGRARLRRDVENAFSTTSPLRIGQAATMVAEDSLSADEATLTLQNADDTSPVVLVANVIAVLAKR